MKYRSCREQIVILETAVHQLLIHPLPSGVPFRYTMGGHQRELLLLVKLKSIPFEGATDMKMRMQREQIVLLERILYENDYANIKFSRHGKFFEWITKRSTAEPLEDYIGTRIKLTIECWYDFTWKPIEEV